MFGEARFVSRGCVLVDYAFVDRFIDQRDCWIEKLNASIFVVTSDRGTQLLNRSAQFGAITAVDLVALGILPYAFLC